MMELPECLTITLSRNQKQRLVPFLASWMTYMILYVPIFGYPPQTISAAFFKILPILSLCVYIFTENKEIHELFRPESWLLLSERDLTLLLGLLCSSLGDICMVWREVLFVPSLLCFAVAHMFYIQAMATKNTISRTKSLYLLLGIDTFLFIKSGIDSYILTVLVGLYTALIFTMSWRATASYETQPTKARLLGCIGALMFTLSDLLIAVDKWLLYVPMSSLLIMSTYYIAQLGIALSATKEIK